MEVSDFKDKKIGDTDIAEGVFIDDTLSLKWYNFLIDKGYKDTSKVCVFQPRVQVLDNWGWCTGECDKTYKDPTQPTASKATNGCYSEYPYDTNSLVITKDQCKIENDKSGEYQWVNFNNIIVVAPSE